MVVLNDSNPELEEVLQKIKENDGYCPCALIKDENTKCNCKEFREMKRGVCHCGAFVKI